MNQENWGNLFENKKQDILKEVIENYYGCPFTTQCYEKLFMSDDGQLFWTAEFNESAVPERYHQGTAIHLFTFDVTYRKCRRL